MLRAAAHTGEDDLRRLWETDEQEGLGGARFWVGILQGKGLLRPDLTDREVVDILWLMMTPDNFYRLVDRRGWSRRMYERWLADAIARLLLE